MALRLRTASNPPASVVVDVRATRASVARSAGRARVPAKPQCGQVAPVAIAAIIASAYDIGSRSRARLGLGGQLVATAPRIGERAGVAA